MEMKITPARLWPALIACSITLGFAKDVHDSSRAVAAMEKAARFYRESTHLAISFKTRMYWSATEEWNSSKGTLWLSGRDKFHVFLPELELVSDGKTLWKYSKSNKQVSLENFGDSRGNRHPSQILFEFLKCKPQKTASVNRERKKMVKIILEPGAGLRHYDSLQVLIREKSGAPYQVRTVDPAGNISIYTITHIKRKADFKEKDFHFTPPKEIEIIDLRW